MQESSDRPEDEATLKLARRDKRKKERRDERDTQGKTPEQLPSGRSSAGSSARQALVTRRRPSRLPGPARRYPSFENRRTRAGNPTFSTTLPHSRLRANSS
jgi:hypothetical protein